MTNYCENCGEELLDEDRGEDICKECRSDVTRTCDLCGNNLNAGEDGVCHECLGNEDDEEEGET